MKRIQTAITALIVLMLGFALSTGSALSGDKETDGIRDKLLKTFPKITAGEIRRTAVAGLLEVEAGGNIVYYYPEKDYLIFGEILSKEGKSLTAERKEELTAKKLKDVPLDKGIKIGNGKNVVIEFTDPDCPYCRKAFDYFKTRQDVTKYVFMLPLPFHKDAEPKAKYIFCASDKAKAYSDVMSGRLDGKQLDVCTDEQATALLAEHKQIATKIGVTGTPAFWINQKFVSGANIPLIESYLRKTN